MHGATIKIDSLLLNFIVLDVGFSEIKLRKIKFAHEMTIKNENQCRNVGKI
jgi:hypothetical protein